MFEQVDATDSARYEQLMELCGEASLGMKEHSASEVTATSAEFTPQRATGAQLTGRPHLSLT